MRRGAASGRRRLAAVSAAGLALCSLSTAAWTQEDAGAGAGDESPLFTGFGELRGGVRVQRDPFQDRATLGEARLHLESDPVTHERFRLRLAADLMIDSLAEDASIDLERGRGFVDLREAYVLLVPVSFIDAKIGRQILGWGTSTSLFINDLFPKDWEAFLLGRHSELLKAPSDAVKVSLFARIFDLDLVYVPRFDADRFISGDRISFYNPMTNSRAGQNLVVDADVPDRWFEDAEGHARLTRNLGGRELAAYAYRGFWKSPGGFDPMAERFTFPRLAAYGASYRQQLASGIAQMEGGYYDSFDDRSGDDPLVNNSELRGLAGYERAWPSLADDLTLGFEYYVEWMQQYDEYVASLPEEAPVRDEVRHLVVLQMQKLLLGQNLTFSLYTYVSPSDRDVYIRTVADYKFEDDLTVFAGANIFSGAEEHTFFGQLETNSNAYVAVRYGF